MSHLPEFEILEVVLGLDFGIGGSLPFVVVVVLEVFLTESLVQTVVLGVPSSQRLERLSRGDHWLLVSRRTYQIQSLGTFRQRALVLLDLLVDEVLELFGGVGLGIGMLGFVVFFLVKVLLPVDLSQQVLVGVVPSFQGEVIS